MIYPLSTTAGRSPATNKDLGIYMFKMDMHCHSKYCERPTDWVLQKIGCPESFTEPLDIYRRAKALGMTHVTITDHNDIRACLDIAHFGDVIISEEVTAYFPEDRCKVHVLVYNITQNNHDVIYKIRENIYDLVDYLNREEIFYALAHPLYSINGKLSPLHLEKALLLFDVFELNGTRDESLNASLKQILQAVTKDQIVKLMDKYRFGLSFVPYWRKSLIGGSDDHSSLNLCSRYTQAQDADNWKEFLEQISLQRNEVYGHEASPHSFARNLYGIAYQYYRRKWASAKKFPQQLIIPVFDKYLTSLSPNSAGPGSLVDKIIGYWKKRAIRKFDPSKFDSLLVRLYAELVKLITNDPELLNIIRQIDRKSSGLDKDWFKLISVISNKLLSYVGNRQLNSISEANIFKIFDSIGSVGMLYALLAPYFVSYTLFGKDRVFSGKIRKHFLPASKIARLGAKTPERIAHFTDTFFETNGVSLTLRRQLKTAQELKEDYRLIVCDNVDRNETKGVKFFKAIGAFEFAEYPGQKIFYPPFLDMLEYCFSERITHIHSSTPGPVGLAALAISRILQLPISGTYHTSFPHYAKHFTDDETMENMIWKYMNWYYGEMERILVPSRNTGNELAAKGFDKKKIRRYPRGVDTKFFNPSRKKHIHSGQFLTNNTINLLYVGRVSKEKNLDFLMDVFKELVKRHSNISLTICGDGPQRKPLEDKTKGLPCRFTGKVVGEKLADLYASSDIFLFPSNTDTFGNVVLEAQSSGLPVLVTTKGGPQENIQNGVTGYAISTEDKTAWIDTITNWIVNPESVEEMSNAARRYAMGRCFKKAFKSTLKLYVKTSLKNKKRKKIQIPQILSFHSNILSDIKPELFAEQKS